MRDAVGEARRLAQEREQRLLRALQAAGTAGLTALEAQNITAIPERGVRRALARLEGRGQARRDGARWYALAPAAAATGGAGPGLRADLDECLAMVPSEAHRAFVRLLLACIASRWHLVRTLPTGWPSFLAFGEPRQGKTSLAYIVAEVYGIPTDRTPGAAVSCVHNALRETAKSLFGRRRMQHGHMTVEPAPELALPFALIDECDKPQGTYLDELLAVLDGSAIVRIERTEILVRYTPMVAFNAAAGAGMPPWLHAAYQARSVMLDTRPLRLTPQDWIPALSRLLPEVGRSPLPRIDLRHLRVSAAGIDEAQVILSRLLGTWLAPERTLLADGRFLARIVPGWQALSGQTAQVAALLVARDYLTCTATIPGAVRPGYQAAIAAALAGLPAPVASPVEVEEEPEPEAPPERAKDLFVVEDLMEEARRAQRDGIAEGDAAGARACETWLDAHAEDPEAVPPVRPVPELPAVPLLVTRVLNMSLESMEGRTFGVADSTRVYRAGREAARRYGEAQGWNKVAAAAARRRARRRRAEEAAQRRAEEAAQRRAEEAAQRRAEEAARFQVEENAWRAEEAARRARAVTIGQGLEAWVAWHHPVSAEGVQRLLRLYCGNDQKLFWSALSAFAAARIDRQLVARLTGEWVDSGDAAAQMRLQALGHAEGRA